MEQPADHKKQICVFLWATPRSVSTAFTKCMSFVPGIQIWHEPYYYCHRNETSMKIIESFNSEKKVAEMKNDTAKVMDETTKGQMSDNELFRFPWVKNQLETDDMDKDIVFVKDIAFLLHGRYEFLPSSRKFRHTFLIRDPRRVYPSLRKLLLPHIPVEYQTTFDIRMFPLYDAPEIFRRTYELWKNVQEHFDHDAFIIDAGDLTAHPEVMLPKYFEAIGVPYEDSYLTWDKAPDITTQWKTSFEAFTAANEGLTHMPATSSSCFRVLDKDPRPSVEMTDDVIKCVEESMPYYNAMYEQRVKP